jgi:hypothetical protein
VPAALQAFFILLAVLGLGFFVAELFAARGDESRLHSLWGGYFVAVLFFFFLAMGAASWLAIQYVTGAKWFVVLKRLPEGIASFAYKGGALLVLVTLAGIPSLYSEWSTVNPESHYPYAGTVKQWFLSPGVHAVKLVAYMVILAVATWVLVGASRSNSGDHETIRLRRLKVSIPYLIVFAFVFSLFAWDSVMSITPRWFSTMFGVYCFSGAFVSALALMMLMCFWMQHRTRHLQHRHMYDLGTYVMGFATFMMYIGFSQFMLIWYANIPDETQWYLDRYAGGWGFWMVMLPVLKWVIPFFLLMPPPLRTNFIAQALVCLSILGGQYLDLYLIVMPTYFPEAVAPSIVNVMTFLGVGGVFGWGVVNYLGGQTLLPVGDPDLLSSVNGDYLHA